MFSEMVQQGGDIVAAATAPTTAGISHHGMSVDNHTTALHGEDEDAAMNWDAADDGQFDAGGFGDVYYQAAADGYMDGNAGQRWGVEGL